ncbi:GNAT family protein [Tenacibaculum sp.]|nr:GNAT family protein [Tenacibaculum sp.]
MVELRKYDLKYVKYYAEFRTNPKIYINGFDSTPNPFTIENALLFFNENINKKKQDRFLIFYKGEFCGDIGIYLKDDVYKHNAEIGFWIAEPYWNKGIATKAIELMTDYAFKNFNLKKIIACVFEFNKSSMKTLTKCGYELEAVLKNENFKNGAFYNQHRFSKFKSE